MRAERAIGGGMKWVVLSVWLNIKAIINCKKFSNKNDYKVESHSTRIHTYI